MLLDNPLQRPLLSPETQPHQRQPAALRPAARRRAWAMLGCCSTGCSTLMEACWARCCCCLALSCRRTMSQGCFPHSPLCQCNGMQGKVPRPARQPWQFGSCQWMATQLLPLCLQLLQAGTCTCRSVGQAASGGGWLEAGRPPATLVQAMAVTVFRRRPAPQQSNRQACKICGAACSFAMEVPGQAQPCA